MKPHTIQKNPQPLDCPHCGSPGVLHTDCPHPVAYCRSCCVPSQSWPRQYRDTPRSAVLAWNAQVRKIRALRKTPTVCSPSSDTPETDAAFEDIYKPPYRVGLSRLAPLLRFVRGLETARNHNRVCIERMRQERLLLAKLAAKEPQFFNPLVAMEAEALRDRILSENAGITGR